MSDPITVESTLAARRLNGSAVWQWPALIVALPFLCLALPASAATNPQPAILGASDASNRAVIFPDPANAPANQTLVPNLPSGAFPHGVAYFGSDNALISDLGNSRIFVVQISSAALVSTIDTQAAGYNGTGTIAVAPNLSAALATGGSNSLYVIEAPFDPSSTINAVTLPGTIATYQTQAIVFNNAGRAYVYNRAGISVLDPPYSSVAFTIPVPENTVSGAIAISPDGQTLLTTTLADNLVRIFKAPFIASSTATTVAIPAGSALDGIAIAPNGSAAIVVSAGTHQAAGIAAPFTGTSTVSTLSLPAGSQGFEDVGISADSQLAILTGNSTNEPPVFVQAPFNADAVTSSVPITGVDNSARGSGAVRFLPPGLAPGLTISKSAPATISPGATLTYTLSYSNTGTANATQVVIRDPLPAGTTFVSATDGGILVDGTVVYNIGAVNAGAATQTVAFTVTVRAEPGGTVDNNNYTIEANGVSPIPGPPVTTAVNGGQPSPTPARVQAVNISTRVRVAPGDNALIGGFIVAGSAPKKVIVRALGPSLMADGAPLPGTLQDPVLDLYTASGTLLDSNDDWRTEQEAAITATKFAPKDGRESALVATLQPGSYTAVLHGKGSASGIALVEAYDLESTAPSQMANISSRGQVLGGDDAMIGGFILSGASARRVLLRAIGPELTPRGVPGALQDTTLELYTTNGTLILSNDNWRTDQEAEISSTGLEPGDKREAAIVQDLGAGSYTAIVRGKGGSTGVGLLEIYVTE